MTGGEDGPIGGEGETILPDPREARGDERKSWFRTREVDPSLVAPPDRREAYRETGSTTAEEAEVLLREQDGDGHDRAAQGHVGTLPLAWESERRPLDHALVQIGQFWSS